MKTLKDCPRCCKRVHIHFSADTLDDIEIYRVSIQHIEQTSICEEAEPFRNSSSDREQYLPMREKLLKTWNKHVRDYPEAEATSADDALDTLASTGQLIKEGRVAACVILIEANDRKEPFRVHTTRGDDDLGRLLCKGWAVWMKKIEGDRVIEFALCRFCGEVVRDDDCLKSKDPTRNAVHRSCSLKRSYILTGVGLRADGAQIFLADLDVPITCEICGEPMMTTEAIEPIADGELSPRCHSACKYPYHRARTEPED